MSHDFIFSLGSGVCLGRLYVLVGGVFLTWGYNLLILKNQSSF
jgi:hypothetical protein